MSLNDDGGEKRAGRPTPLFPTADCNNQTDFDSAIRRFDPSRPAKQS
jgi:hypothetical protein